MATNKPPSGWNEDNLTWGTDAVDENPAGGNLIGTTAIKITASGSGDAHLISDLYPVSAPVTISGRSYPEPYRVFTLAQASGVSSLQRVRVFVNWYDVSQTYISSKEINNSKLVTANLWQEIEGIVSPPATARFAALLIGKNGNPFTVYFDNTSFRRAPRQARAVVSVLANHVPGAPVKVLVNASDFNFGNMLDTTTSQIIIPRSGRYAIAAGLHYVAFTDTGSCSLDIYRNGVSWRPSVENYASLPPFTSGHLGQTYAVVAERLVRGDYLELYSIPLDPVALTVTMTATTRNFLNVVEIL